MFIQHSSNINLTFILHSSCSLRGSAQWCNEKGLESRHAKYFKGEHSVFLSSADDTEITFDPGDIITVVEMADEG